MPFWYLTAMTVVPCVSTSRAPGTEGTGVGSGRRSACAISRAMSSAKPPLVSRGKFNIIRFCNFNKEAPPSTGGAVVNSALLAAALAIFAGLVGVHALHALEQVAAVRPLHIGAAGAGLVAVLAERFGGAGRLGGAIFI